MGKAMDKIRRYLRWTGLPLLFIGLAQHWGCASYEAKDVAQAKLEAMPHSLNESRLAIGVDPFVQREREEQIFAADLLSAAVLPIRVMVKNNGDSPVRIEADNFKLVLAKEHMVSPRSAVEVAQLFAPKQGVGDYASTGVGALGGLAGPIGSIAGRLFGAVSSGVFDQYRTEALQSRQQDYVRKEFKSVNLVKGEFAQGFLFFVLPKETPAFDQATLTLSVLENQTDTATFKMALKGLGYPGATASKESASGL